MMNTLKRRDKGSVSLFIVIFVALLIITIATAFIRIMLQDQYQATANDLSRSALDSANAGVEDAKRAIIEYYKSDITGKPDCSTVSPGANPRCDTLRAALVGDTTPPNDGWTTNCKATTDAGVASLTKGEVLVRSLNAARAEDEQLNQAYTCVNVQMNPEDYKDQLKKDESLTIPLKPVNGKTFTKVKIQWYMLKTVNPLQLTANSIPYELPDTWPASRPPILKAQLLQYKSNFRLSDFEETNVANNKSNFSLFFLPTSVDIAAYKNSQFSNDLRQNRSTLSAQPVTCAGAASPSDIGRYACEMTVSLPCASDPCTDYPNQNAERTAYLKLSQYYGSDALDVKISLLTESGDEVRFGDVQAVVDSTGRANDVFRRIKSYVNLRSTSVPNPEAAVDVTRSLCKEFLVTTETAYQGRSGVCDPPPTS